jgi:5-methylcytosine-specific restriction endonuclease McrA
MDKLDCLKCHKSFTFKTLNKNNGICGYCIKKIIKEKANFDLSKPESNPNFDKLKHDTIKIKIKETTNLKKPKSNRLKFKKIDRQKVWYAYIDAIRKNNDNCLLCNFNHIDPFIFEIGHDTSVKHGGQNNIENLMPICRTCNNSQGTLTIKEFKSAMVKHTPKQNTKSRCC